MTTEQHQALEAAQTAITVALASLEHLREVCTVKRPSESAKLAQVILRAELPKLREIDLVLSHIEWAVGSYPEEFGSVTLDDIVSRSTIESAVKLTTAPPPIIRTAKKWFQF